MQTPASIARHPIHPMIVPIAIGGFVLSFIFDIVCLSSGNADPWATVSYYTMIGGIVAALIAAVFGFTDMLSLPAGQTKKVALTHMSINLLVVVLFLWNAWMRHGTDETTTGQFILSLVSIVLLIISGWLGGKMVYETGVGVDTGAAESTAAPPAHGQRHIEA